MTRFPTQLWSALAIPLALACNAREGRAPSHVQLPGVASPAKSGADGPTQLVERGRYLVSHVAACAECHSPRKPDGTFDRARWLSGSDCYVDVVPDDPNIGCISTRNLTNHETGLKNRSDREIKDMFLKGERPDGKALHPFMPYRFFANMRERDADAIVAYLRTVPGVERTAARSQPPFIAPEHPAPRVPADRIPWPKPDYPSRAAALRGRYLAAEIGVCLDCHTPRSNGSLAIDRAFQGGMQFPRAALHLPASYPPIIYAANLTPDATGIAGYPVDQIVRVLKQGIDRHGTRLCPPMPAGPAAPFGGIVDEDARDIAHYLLSLPAAANSIPNTCRAPSLPDPTDSQPLWLSATGLYQDITHKQLAPDLIPFEPAYPLWTDGAEKHRWLRLPPGTQIDTADMDHWRFPVGAMLFKEFSLDGRLIETRLIARTGTGDNDYWMGAFLWNEDQSDARSVPDGAPNARGTQHDVPAMKSCATCHNGEAGRVLGFSAVQLPAAPRERLSSPPPSAFTPPGDSATAAALGYLHGNCAHCHNPSGSARPDTDMNLRLSVMDQSPPDTQTYRTTISKALSSFRDSTKLRVAPGDPEHSALLYRMSDGSRAARMPPLASKQIDRVGVERVRAWIERL